MAFRLHPDEPVADGLRRLATNALKCARDVLEQAPPPHDEGIHEARKRLKKVRAILQLIDSDDGRGLKKSRKRLRRINRTLSPLRDRDAMLEILKKLSDQDPQLFGEHAYARLRHRLLADKQAAMRAADEKGALEDIDRELRALRREVKEWRTAHRKSGALEAGLLTTYRRGRKAMADVREHPDADRFHKCRKALKRLKYQLRLVEDASPRIKKDVAALDAAESALGDDHNVVVLCRELSKEPSLSNRKRIEGAATRYQARLRRDALARVKLVYARPARDFVGDVVDDWRRWQRTADRQTKRRKGQRPKAA